MQGHAKEILKREAEAEQGVERTRPVRVYTPSVDILEKKDKILVTADMPGVDARSVDVTLEKNILTIYGRVEPEIPAGHGLNLSEYGVGDYQRVFTISDEIDRGKIQATVKNGVLKLILPKSEGLKTKKIEVMTEN